MIIPNFINNIGGFMIPFHKKLGNSMFQRFSYVLCRFFEFDSLTGIIYILLVFLLRTENLSYVSLHFFFIESYHFKIIDL